MSVRRVGLIRRQWLTVLGRLELTEGLTSVPWRRETRERQYVSVSQGECDDEVRVEE